VRVTESLCPFCEHTVSDEDRARLAPNTRRRMTRAAAFVFGATVAITGASVVGACGDEETEGDSTSQGGDMNVGGAMALYGSPGGFDQTGGGGSGGMADGGGGATGALYGAPGGSGA
jgi:hypothetical protein